MLRRFFDGRASATEKSDELRAVWFHPGHGSTVSTEASAAGLGQYSGMSLDET